MMYSKFVFTGPESSGKTTLARALSGQLPSPCVPEFSRVYLEAWNAGYDWQNLREIYSGQTAWEAWYAAHYPGKKIVCDTDWTVIRIWEQVRFGSTRLTAGGTCRPGTFYFLCTPDIPWEPDPLRENPGDRLELFALYVKLLEEIRAPYRMVEGNMERRLAEIASVIRKNS